MLEEIYGTKNVYHFISKICNRTNGKDNGFMWTEQFTELLVQFEFHKLC